MIPHLLRPLAIVALALLFLIPSFIQPNLYISAQTGCPQLQSPETGNDPKRSKNAWPQNAAVKVNILQGPTYRFSDTEVQAIKDAFNSWKLVQCAKVTFEFKECEYNNTGCINISGLYVNVSKSRLNPHPDGTPVLGLTQSASDGTALHHASMFIDHRITNAVAFKKTLVHEVGHNFGLRHCLVILETGCGSAMDESEDYNDTQLGFTQPTDCDLIAARQAGNYTCPPGGGGGGDDETECYDDQYRTYENCDGPCCDEYTVTETYCDGVLVNYREDYTGSTCY